MYYLYVLKSKIANKSYVGITDSLSRRLKEHNQGRSYYTKRYIPWDIVYTEEFSTKAEVLKRERYLKTSAGRKFLKTVFEKLME